MAWSGGAEGPAGAGGGQLVGTNWQEEGELLVISCIWGLLV